MSAIGDDRPSQTQQGDRQLRVREAGRRKWINAVP
jgi:hypothetical protein